MTKEEKIKAFDPNGVGQKNDNFIGLPFNEQEAQVIFLPIPWDVTVSFGAGTSSGPRNILASSVQLDLFDPDIPEAWKMGLYFSPISEEWLSKSQNLRYKTAQYISFLELGGDLTLNQGMQSIREEINLVSLQLNHWVKNNCNALLEKGKLIGLIGGEHSVPLGFLEALSEKYSSFGILQIDAHLDLRQAYEGFTFSHASIFYNALELDSITQLTAVGIRDYCEAEWQLVKANPERIKVFLDQDLHRQSYFGKPFERICQEIIDTLPEYVYISFDIDGLDPKLCPNTGTPVPGGLDFHQVIFLLYLLVKNGHKIIGFDLCEVAGVGHDWDGNVGARVAYKLANLMAASNGYLNLAS